MEGSDALQGGMWQKITLAASEGLAVYIPYFIQDPGSMRAQNGTVLDMDAGERLSMNILFPPRNDAVVFFIGEIGRTEWPIRPADDTWLGQNARPQRTLVDGTIPLVMETVRPARSSSGCKRRLGETCTIGWTSSQMTRDGRR